MNINLLINLRDKETIYEQIQNQIIRFIEIGVLKPNDKLPSVRMLASDLGINPNTVARAYGDLERKGVIYTLNKKGVFVAGADENVKQTNNAKNMIRQIKADGISKEKVLELVDEVYQQEDEENA